MLKEDCFAYDQKKKCCKALNETYCKKGKCGFYKTVEEQKKSLEKEGKRLKKYELQKSV